VYYTPITGTCDKIICKVIHSYIMVYTIANNKLKHFTYTMDYGVWKRRNLSITVRNNGPMRQNRT